MFALCATDNIIHVIGFPIYIYRYYQWVKTSLWCVFICAQLALFWIYKCQTLCDAIEQTHTINIWGWCSYLDWVFSQRWTTSFIYGITHFGIWGNILVIHEEIKSHNEQYVEHKLRWINIMLKRCRRLEMCQNGIDYRVRSHVSEFVYESLLWILWYTVYYFYKFRIRNFF